MTHAPIEHFEESRYDDNTNMRPDFGPTARSKGAQAQAASEFPRQTTPEDRDYKSDVLQMIRRDILELKEELVELLSFELKFELKAQAIRDLEPEDVIFRPSAVCLQKLARVPIVAAAIEEFELRLSHLERNR